MQSLTVAELKRRIRRQAYQARNTQPDKDRLSLDIQRRFLSRPDYRNADTVMLYVHCRSEVRTGLVLDQALSDRKQVVIPYCKENDSGDRVLGLWRLENTGELLPGTWGIPEPGQVARNDPDRNIAPEQIDLIMVPGVGFDRLGGRLGNGAGYYDRLLVQLREDACLSAVCYQSQLFDQIPMQEQDVFMDFVLTEHETITGKG